MQQSECTHEAVMLVLITVQCELQSTVNWTLTPYKTTIYGEHRHRDNYVAHLCFVLTAWSTSHSQSNSLHTHSNKSNSQAAMQLLQAEWFEFYETADTF